MAPLPDGASDALTTWIYDIGWKIARTLPEPVANGTFRQIADALWLRRSGGVGQLERNLRRVHPDGPLLLGWGRTRRVHTGRVGWHGDAAPAEMDVARS